MNNKKKIVSFIKEKTGYIVSPDAMFDVQVLPYLSSKTYDLTIYYKHVFIQTVLVMLLLDKAHPRIQEAVDEYLWDCVSLQEDERNEC